MKASAIVRRPGSGARAVACGDDNVAAVDIDDLLRVSKSSSSKSTLLAPLDDMNRSAIES